MTVRPAALRALLLAAAAGSALAGCTVGPTYQRPDLPTPSGYAELAGKAQGSTLTETTAAEPSEADLSAWWTRFHDPELESLIGRAMTGNLDLQAAASRIRQSREQEVVTGAQGLPQVNATANAARLNVSSKTIDAGSLLSAASGSSAASTASSSAAGSDASSLSINTPNHLNYYTAGFDATWELDLFGGVRRGVEAARATTAAQVWRRRDSEVSIAAEVANDYLQYRLAQSRLVVLNGDLKRQQGLFAIIRDRFNTGLVTDLDVNQQRTQLANTQSQIPQVEAQAKASLHALAVLIGQPPEALSAELAQSKPLPPVPPDLPVGMPSELLRRRPDIRASERQLAAASAQIGVRTAALYPSLNLIGLASFGSNQIQHVFDADNAISAGLAMAQWSVFSGGRNRANIRAAKAAYQEAYLSYSSTVLTALKDVEDSLARYAADQRRWTALNGAFGAAQNSFQIAQQQYATGLVDYTSVFNAEGSLLQIQDQLTQADGALAQDVVSIYKALGGGWTVDPRTDRGVGAE